MQVELDRAESKLAEKREELRILKEHIRTEAAEMVARKKRFRVFTIVHIELHIEIVILCFSRLLFSLDI